MSTELDRALAQLKRLRDCHYESEFTKGYSLGMDHAIQVIERLGGLSPEQRAAEEGDGNTPVTGPWPRPIYHKQAVGMRCDERPLTVEEERVLRGALRRSVTVVAPGALNGDDTPPDPEAA